MKNLLVISCWFAFIALFTSCYSNIPIVREAPQNNQTYEVDYLFEHDGCKVYRFYDKGNYVYFTNCNGNVTAIKNDSTRERVDNSVKVIYEDYHKISK